MPWIWKCTPLFAQGYKLFQNTTLASLKALLREVLKAMSNFKLGVNSHCPQPCMRLTATSGAAHSVLNLQLRDENYTTEIWGSKKKILPAFRLSQATKRDKNGACLSSSSDENRLRAGNVNCQVQTGRQHYWTSWQFLQWKRIDFSESETGKQVSSLVQREVETCKEEDIDVVGT